MLFNVTQYVYLMFNVRIYSMEVVHQKQPILWVIEEFITNNEDCKEILVMCDSVLNMF